MSVDAEDVDLALVDWKATAEVMQHEITRLRRGLQATEQALLDTRAEARGAQASGDQARAELTKLRDLVRQATSTDRDLDEGLTAWLALREMVCGVPHPPVFTPVTVAHLAWLHGIADAAGEWATAETGDDSPTANSLRAALDEVA